jgi:uncharacterized membrane protein YfcA
MSEALPARPATRASKRPANCLAGAGWYLVTQGGEIAKLWPVLLAAAVGAVIGTVVGERVLRGIPEPIYRRAVSALVLALGAFMLLRIGR